VDREKDKDWQAKAACLSLNAEIFFPVGGSDEAVAQTDEAIKICNSCKVKYNCLETALKARRDNGIWGGKTEQMRKDIIKNYHKTHPRQSSRCARDVVDTSYYDDIINYI
jgi:WhiB family redox-sensing transcriptional regulator